LERPNPSAVFIIERWGDNAREHKLPEIMAALGQPEPTISTIAIFDGQDRDQNPRVLQPIAKATGGEASESLQEILFVSERIAQDKRNQYFVAYEPANRKRDGKYRAMEVKANAPGCGGLSVCTRTGYFAFSTVNAGGKGDRS
jgi:Ca-activated chloride channel family protein